MERLNTIEIMSIPFRKYHGLGNDFVILEDELDAEAEGVAEGVARCRIRRVGPATALLASGDACRSICTRSIGVGADGVIFYRKLTSDVRDKYTLFATERKI